MYECCEGHNTKIYFVIFDDAGFKLAQICAEGDAESLVSELESGGCPICDMWPGIRRES